MAAICVFCASSSTIDRLWLDLATRTGEELATRGHTLVSGGGCVGMMGAVADGARAGGAHTLGVIPQSLVDLEVADTAADELIVTGDMGGRKNMMIERSDAFLILPGGLGTLDELFEAMVLVQTQKVTSFPIVLLGAAFWGPMIDWIRGTLVAEGMVSEKDLDLIQVVDSPEEAVNLVLHGHVRAPSTNGDQRPE